MTRKTNHNPEPDQEKTRGSSLFRPCLLIPVYNNRNTIANVLEDVSRFGLLCILVDDGSDEETQNVLDVQTGKREWVRLLRHDRNRGKGAAVVTGLLHAHRSGYSHVVQIDADGQHEVSDIPRFLAEAGKHPDALILGDPIFDESVPVARIYGRQLSRFWVWIETLSFAIRDPLFGFRVYPVSPATRLIQSRRVGSRMEFDPEIAVRLFWAGTPMRNVKTPVKYPRDGLSHFRMFKDNVRISWLHTRLVFGMLPRLPGLIIRRRR